MSVRMDANLLSGEMQTVANRAKDNRVADRRDALLQNTVWQREMERAQISDWLDQGSVVAAPTRVTALGATEQPARPAVPMTSLMEFAESTQARGIAHALIRAGAGLPSVANSTSTVAVNAGKHDGATAEAKTSMVQEVLTQLARTVAEQRSKLDLATVSSSLVSMVPQPLCRSATSSPAETMAATIRCTIRWINEDVRLWFGIDRKDTLSAADMHCLLMQCRSMLASQGARILSVMVNGQLLYEAKNGSPIDAALLWHGKDEGVIRFPDSFYSYFSSQEIA